MNSLVVKNMDVNIELNGTITTIIGPKNSGKTYLLKKIINVVNNDDVYLDEVSIKEYDITFLKNNICVVMDDNNFKCDIVSEELCYYLYELGYRIDEISRKVDYFSRHFKIDKILSCRIENLPVEHKILVKILSLLIIDPKIIGIDNLMGYLSTSSINQLFKYIKDKNINLINVVSNSDLLLMSDNVVVLSNYKSVMSGEVKSLVQGNSILPYMGIKLPFVVDLSQNLILYGVVDKVMTDSRKLVDKIWK